MLLDWVWSSRVHRSWTWRLSDSHRHPTIWRRRFFPPLSQNAGLLEAQDLHGALPPRGVGVSER